MVTIHGRTRCQFYKGAADWVAIAPVVDAVDVPVIANGDIVDAATARQALAQSGAAGVMIGRGAQGAPWALAEVAAGLAGTPAPEVPKAGALADLVATHFLAALSFYGKALGAKVVRKHLGWYMERAGSPETLRREVLTAATPGRVLRLLPLAFDPAFEGAVDEGLAA
jgi:tRNA-dihydrouridine synthase